jgi:hypothetical protein
MDRKIILTCTLERHCSVYNRCYAMTASQANKQRCYARQRIGKHVPAAMNTYATIELLLETVFSTRSVQRGYNEDNWDHPVESRVDLRVLGSDEKGTQCLGV